MNLKETLKRINEGREKAEAAFVFCCWKNGEYFDEYKFIGDKDDHTLQNKDAQFYWRLGMLMHSSGINHIDDISVDTFLTGKEKALKKYEEMGGSQTVRELMSLVHNDNAEGYYTIISRMNALQTWAIKTEELMGDLDRFSWSSGEDIYEAFEDINNSIAINTSYSEKIQTLDIDEEFIESLNNGEEVGYNYGKYCPILNWITLGAMPASMFMLAGHSGKGKTSFAFENLLMSLHYQDNVGHIGIISNEEKIKKYKMLLLNHVLTKDMKYYGLTRKQLQKGGYTEEQKEKIREAAEIINTQYQDIHFLKMFDNNIDKIIKYIKKMSYENTSVILYDTFKVSENTHDKSMWESLLLDSRKIFQICSKLEICCITTYQLALHTLNIRYLDETCLSLGKQIKEVYETILLVRPVWADEYDGEKYDIKPWRFKKNQNGQYELDENGKRIKEAIKLDPEEKYFLVFVNKTRSDEDQQVILYRWRGRFNEFRELGYANPMNAHIYS